MKIVSAKAVGTMPVFDLSVNHPSHSFVHSSGVIVHNCAYLICNEPIQNFIPTADIGGIRSTQYTAGSAEEAGALKYDFLVVNSLKDIADAVKLIQQHQGVTLDQYVEIDGRSIPSLRALPFEGKLYDVWRLPSDQAVFNDICESDTETVFQFNTPAARQWLAHFNDLKAGTEHKLLDSIDALADFTALDRPGPLDAMMTDETGDEHNMLVEYARRAKLGKGNYKSDLPILDELLPETYGIIVYQEQLTRIFKEMGGTTGMEAENFRVHISKKQMAKVTQDREIFMRGAVEKVGQETATRLWDMMCTFASYGFCKAHAVGYVYISYVSAFLKRHYPLEWWTAVLCNADKNEIYEKFWIHCGHLINLPEIKLSGDNFKVVNGRIQAPTSLLQGIGEAAHQELIEVAKDATDLDSLLRAIQNRKDRLSTVDATGKKTNGRSSLNRRIMYTLLISGTMDSFFPADYTMLDKLSAYERAIAARDSIGKKKAKKPKAIDEAYLSLDRVSIFQLRKQLLPAYSEDTISLCQPLTEDLTLVGDKLYYTYRGAGQSRVLKVATSADLMRYEEQTAWTRGHSITVAVPCYLQDDERRLYGSPKKEMAKLVLDIGGTRKEFVMWPDRDSGSLPDFMESNMKGAVAIAILHKYSSERPFAVESLDILRKPFNPKEEASE